ncbi:MAG TPA: lycopene beta-cyclase CrtY [Kofleriaceae bacterium]|nr:lycopene beta-cyclase CrtY [Kofleriaceae bacterium]
MALELDYAIVGGGLQGGLIALAVRARQPTARIAIVERGAALGGNHTWCFHAGDVPETASWVKPLVVSRWSAYDVAFPGRRRQLPLPYALTTSRRLDACVRKVVDELWLGETAVSVGAHRISTQARDVTAAVVIDARGPERAGAPRCGWQTFVGQEVRVPGHGLELPMVMDATVPQRGAFTFMYALPISPDVLLLEDTAFADSSYLDVEAGRRAITRYARARGWTIERVIREETGVLPLPLEVDGVAPAAEPAPPLAAGYAGGWFHPVTGYSFPIAARLAEVVATRPPAALFGPALTRLAQRHRAQLAFATRLNRMLFGWFAPNDRYHVLERFYSLPEGVIRRFYALETTALDRALIVAGRPPRRISWRAVISGRRPS